MTYTNEMVLPRNFAQHSEDEMMYLDGGLSLANSTVANAIDWGLTALLGAGGAALGVKAARYFAQAGKILFNQQLKRKLIAWGIASATAGKICGAIAAVVQLFDRFSPGARVAKYWDSRDSKRYDTRCQF